MKQEVLEPQFLGEKGPAGESPAFLAGGGEMGELLRARDWTSSPLGPPATWPRSLKTAIRIMLTSRQPIWVGWGAELLFFYNDAYKPIIGGKHPWALGRPTAEVWSEIWSAIEPLLATAMGGIEGTYVEEQLLIMERSGYPEETYYTFSYSPISEEDGRPGGIICANTDDTQRVVGERQLALLRDVSTATARTRSWQEVCARGASALRGNRHDLTFSIIYMQDGELARDGRPQGKLWRVGCAGIPAAHPAAPMSLDLSEPQPWPFDEVLHSLETQVCPARSDHFAEPLPTGAWLEPSKQVALLPIIPGGEKGRRGVLVVGLNPFRLFDGAYRDFLGLLSGQLAAAVANADAFEEERRRAESLAEIDRVKTTFFSNVSHEFRTPLTLMLGPLEESLEGGDLTAVDEERLRVVHRNGLRLLKLVNTLLDFSRIEAGRRQARFEATDLSRLTADLASNFRAATDRAGLELCIDCEPDLAPMYVDRDMWEKIVLNLVSNAFKFTFQGGITVSLRRVGNGVELAVRDTGTGIPAAELPRLFERFHRVEGAHGRSFEGSGIGLALVRELVDEHGGVIHVESEVGRGSVFKVTLPAGSAHLPAEQVREGAGVESTAVAAQAFLEEALRWLPSDAPAAEDVGVVQNMPGGARARRSRILVVDDNADMRDYIARLLGPRHDCVTVNDGAAALRVLEAARPDLVLTDLMMPVMDGFALIAAIRADDALKDLPVIVLSARAGEESSVEGLEAGADDYLVKPFGARELIARVDGAIALADMRREMSEALREEARSLERMVAARTAELVAANAQLRAEAAAREKAEISLRQSQKMEAVGKLTGGVAHDFNNLLQVIGGNLQLLAKEVAGRDRAEERVRNALSGVSRGSKLAAQLLAFGRRQPLAPKVVNLGRFLRGLDDLLRRALGDGIEIETVIAGGLWNTLVDPSQVENAVLNLAINARDAMQGHGRLTIEAGNAALSDDYSLQHDDVKAGQYVMLAVTDTGCGMKPDVIEHVFEPFFTTKPEGQGTGLGLSMVYGFVKQSGGHIKIYSEPDQGTTIRLYLPRALAAEETAAEVEVGPVTGGSETVLVVEDDEEVRGTVVDLLTDLGYRVLKARDADAALAILESGAAIDLLFTDVVMPGNVRSPELARQAKARLPDVAVLFTSGYTDNAIVHGGRLDQGIDLLSKPYTREVLARKVRHVLRNQRQRTMAQRGGAPCGVDSGRMPPLRILFVEDDDLIRMAAADMLAGLGHSVFEAGDATQALGIFESTTVDVLMTDLGLPGMSGSHLAAEVRRTSPALPVIYATGADGPPNGDGEPLAGGALMLRKPYDVAALDRVLRAANGLA